MARVVPGRFTAQPEGPFVIFLIGMRVNRLWQPWKWIPTAMAMGPMLKALLAHPEKGLLGVHTFLGWRTIFTVQYWRSFDDLHRFATDQADPHLDSWRAFNKRVGSDGSVGIFHETYLCEANRCEAVYGNMPVFGLAKATRHVAALGKKETAKRRLGFEDQPAVESPPQPGAPATG
jgi:hypothetical protein